ncbi:MULTISPECIES: hypothetical protein [Nocardiopsidaceae]|uniref:Uncharacterized protein n=1 Tax=Streptomonospora nanhaiensis TaxID=1323731 RepID=A0ABY6YQV8_9ACTN|nr:hypothetical protein [Streptomonospora nanhaiensis]WAE74466.1 hypothetical protein OUQ99_04945 [Streptomonospora nanhaiensis]
MTSENSSADRRPASGATGEQGAEAPGAETPGVEVPEADAAEQRAPAGDDDGRWEAPSEESFDQADEGDVVEQSLEVGDEEERR